LEIPSVGPAELRVHGDVVRTAGHTVSSTSPLTSQHTTVSAPSTQLRTGVGPFPVTMQFSSRIVVVVQLGPTPTAELSLLPVFRAIVQSRIVADPPFWARIAPQ